MPKIRINDINLYYEIYGKGDPLLFIHGLGSSTRDWEAQTAYFAKHYKVIVFDLRGHGKSDKPSGAYTIPLFEEDTAVLIKALKLGKVHLTGISLGGMVALQLTVNHPELVKSLVVVNSASEMIVNTLKDRFILFQRFLVLRTCGMRSMGKQIAGRMFPEPKQEELRRIFTERWAENDPSAYRRSLKAVVNWSVTDRLSEILCPVLVLTAEFDYTWIRNRSVWSERIKQCSFKTIKNSRHGTPADQPEEFNRAVKSFLDLL